ncbi:MAG: carbohydrate ABC transporter permease [Defluviitaleaceae bacterium]|nr:carbohydrate ABC transporter permease [Defluviitaleaceae bacterium]
MAIKRSFGENVGQVLMHLFMLLLAISALYPVLLVFMVSISSEASVATQGIRMIPLEFSFAAYELVFATPAMWQAYIVTISVTVIGTSLSLLICSMAGWAASIESVKYRNVMAMFFYIPIVFRPGLLPWFMVITQTLGLRDSFWALIIPTLVTPFNLFLLRNYFRTIPPSLVESAQIDGAPIPRIFLQIVLPLAKPILATCALFISLGYWNGWTEALWFIDNPNLFPLQYMLLRIQQQLELLRQFGIVQGNMPTQTFRLATMFVTIGPIILVYPFVQRFFIKGIMIGAVKG